MAALRKVELKDAPRGPVKIDAYGSSVDNVYITRVDKVKGALQNTVINTYPMVSQFWTYDPEQYLKQPAYSKDYPPCNIAPRSRVTTCSAAHRSERRIGTLPEAISCNSGRNSVIGVMAPSPWSLAVIDARHFVVLRSRRATGHTAFRICRNSY